METDRYKYQQKKAGAMDKDQIKCEMHICAEETEQVKIFQRNVINI